MCHFVATISLNNLYSHFLQCAMSWLTKNLHQNIVLYKKCKNNKSVSIFYLQTEIHFLKKKWNSKELRFKIM